MRHCRLAGELDELLWLLGLSRSDVADVEYDFTVEGVLLLRGGSCTSGSLNIPDEWRVEDEGKTVFAISNGSRVSVEVMLESGMESRLKFSGGPEKLGMLPLVWPGI